MKSWWLLKYKKKTEISLYTIDRPTMTDRQTVRRFLEFYCRMPNKLLRDDRE